MNKYFFKNFIVFFTLCIIIRSVVESFSKQNFSSVLCLPMLFLTGIILYMREIKILFSQYSFNSKKKMLFGNISIGMTKNEVILAWGSPSDRDNIVIDSNGVSQERFIYGRKNKNANYLYFVGDYLNKIYK